MDLFGEHVGSVGLKEPIDLQDLQNPEKGSVFEIDQSSVNPEEAEEAANTYFKGEDVYKNLMRVEDDVAQDIDNGMEPFEAMMKRMEDVSNDGGVWKKIKKPGAGPVVPEGALVRIKYNAYKEFEDEPFDSTYLRNEIEKFRLGQDGSVRGLHVAVSTMKKGEESCFLFKPAYFYGEMGCGDRIPPNCTVLFEIELVSFVERDGVDDYYFMTEEEKRCVTFEFVCKVSKSEREEGNAQFKAEMYHRAIGKYRRAGKILEDYHLKSEEEEKQQRKMLICIYLNMAICHLRLNEYGRVIRLCSQVLEMDEKTWKDHLKALYFKAKARHYLCDFDEARKLLHQAQKMQPQNKEINRALQELDVDMKRFQFQYKEMCQKMVSLGPTAADEDESAKAASSPKKQSERSKQLSSFEEAVRKQMHAFKDDKDLKEMPFPDGQLTQDEIQCIVSIAHDLDMNIQMRGTGQTTRMVIMKKTSK